MMVRISYYARYFWASTSQGFFCTLSLVIRSNFVLHVIKMALLTDYHFNILSYTYIGSSKSYTFIYPQINTKY